MVRAQQVSFESVILLRRGDSRIGIRRFVPARGGFAVFVKIFQKRQAPAWIVRNPIRVFVFQFSRVGPALRPIGPHRHKRASGYLPVIFFPFSLHDRVRARNLDFFALRVHH